MAFEIRDLSVLAYAQGFTLWHYKSRKDALRTVQTDGFFDDAEDMLAPGDLLMVSGDAGARILAVAAAGGVIRTAPLA